MPGQAVLTRCVFLHTRNAVKSDDVLVQPFSMPLEGELKSASLVPTFIRMTLTTDNAAIL